MNVRRSDAQATLAMVHFFPLTLLFIAAAILDRPPTGDAYGPVIMALRAEQWVGPPAVGAFMVLLGLYMEEWSIGIRAALRLVGWILVSITVFAFGLACLWGGQMMFIMIYSLTTPPLVVPMAYLSWQDLADATRAEHV